MGDAHRVKSPKGDRLMSEPEKDFFFGDQHIYVSHYVSSFRKTPMPTSSQRQRAFAVVVPPLFEELARTRKALVTLARELAQQGIDVVRFDYFGTGLSAGKFEQFTIEGARQQLDDVMDYCREQGATRIHLIGVRFGGYLALSNLTSSRAPCDNVVAWEPTTDLTSHIEDLFRAEASNEMIAHGRARATKAEIVANMEDTGTSMIAGYRLSLRAYREFVSAPVLSFDLLRGLSEKFQLIFWDGKKTFNTATHMSLASLWVPAIKLSWKNIRYLEPRAHELLSATAEGILKDEYANA
jgi:alpha/beta superfamily hydrolase